jgi:ribonuclease HI
MPDVSIYTDGSCLGNGNANAKAGIGIFFGTNHPRNISRKLEGPKRETNNTAETKAILAAVEELRPELERGDEVLIHSDSTYAIGACTERGRRLSKTGYVDPRTKQLVPNHELVQQAWETCSKYPNLKFQHVYGHQDGDDPDSFGNRCADRLAVKGAGGTLRVMVPPKVKRHGILKPPSEPALRRTQPDVQEGSGSEMMVRRPARSEQAKLVWLNVPYAQKDRAKALGARWNPGEKSWYVPDYVLGKERDQLVRQWGRPE